MVKTSRSATVVSKYLNDIGQIPLLTHEQEIKLGKTEIIELGIICGKKIIIKLPSGIIEFIV